MAPWPTPEKTAFLNIATNASDNGSEILIRGRGRKSPWASTEFKQGELGKAKQSTSKLRLSLLKVLQV